MFPAARTNIFLNWPHVHLFFQRQNILGKVSLFRWDRLSSDFIPVSLENNAAAVMAMSDDLPTINAFGFYAVLLLEQVGGQSCLPYRVF